jgi:hypothetical protein
MLDRVNQKIESTGGKLSTGEVREIMSSFHAKEPESLFLNAGDLYNLQTQQMVVYSPGDGKAEVYLKPKTGDNPADPLPYFHLLLLEP